MKNYYQILGVERTATADEIKRAYRRLASQHHPDKGGDKQTFQDIQAAYSTLSDPQRRQEYDNPHQQFHFNQGFGGGQPFNFDTIFDIFGTRFAHGAPGGQRQQARMSLWITLADVASGGRRTISVGTQQGTHAVEIEIPRGINDGDTIQYSGIGPGGIDLIIQFRIHAAPGWERQDLTLTTEKSVTIWDCVLGADVVVRDILGNQLNLTVPPMTQPGTVMRLRGRGLTREGRTPGDLMVRITATIPRDIDPELTEMIRQKTTK